MTQRERIMSRVVRRFLWCGLALVAMTSCVFVVRSLNQNNGLIDKQLAEAKKSMMRNTNWKLDTYMIYKTFDGNGDEKLNKNELTAMLLVAGIENAADTAGTLIIVGDSDEDDRLTEDEFKQLFGINS